MEFLTDYNIISDYSDPSSSIFIVKHKPTDQKYRLQSISCRGLSEQEQKALRNKIKIRATISHPNILHFYDHIQHKDMIYLKQEYCEHGTLTAFIRIQCIEKDRQLHENLICRILYQTVFALKTVECFMGQLNLDNVMLSEEYSVKLYNFFNVEAGGSNKSQKQREIKMSQLGEVIFELVTLKNFGKSTFENTLHGQHYSNSFKDLLASMIKDNTEIKKHINKILCHPTVLLQSSQWSKETCFTEKRQQTNIELPQNPAQDYSDRLEKLRRKEAALQIKEQLLKEQERKLAHKEKKLQIMERTVKEKLQQAELYLKRSRESGKSVSSGSSKSSTQTSSKKASYEDHSDPSYVSCADSDIFPTSTKLQTDKIVKPQNFSRTMSERRIRFQTSPLKDHNFARKREARKSWRRSKITEDLENVQPEVTNKDVRRKPFFLSNEYENECTIIQAEYEKTPCDVSNIGWTEETKRQAYEMLRLMKGDGEENVEIKHTYL